MSISLSQFIQQFQRNWWKSTLIRKGQSAVVLRAPSPPSASKTMNLGEPSRKANTTAGLTLESIATTTFQNHFGFASSIRNASLNFSFLRILMLLITTVSQIMPFSAPTTIASCARTASGCSSTIPARILETKILRR